MSLLTYFQATFLYPQKPTFELVLVYLIVLGISGLWLGKRIASQNTGFSEV